MNTFWKIALGFIGGVICTLVAVFFLVVLVSRQPTDREIIKEKREELKRSNMQYFELNTKRGAIKLHTYMPKDSVKLLMGSPTTTDVKDFGNLGVHETWEYKGRNRYVSEFTIDFVDGELESVRQYRE